MLEVELDDDALFLIGRSLVDEFALRTSEEGGAPELDALRLTTGIRLKTYTIDSKDRQTIGNGMSSHHCLPGSALALLFLFCVAGSIADGSGIDEDLCPLKGHQARCLRIPLIPAHHHTQSTYTGVDGVEAEIAWGEVELLVVGRIIGDVHLAIDACDGTIFLKDHGSVVVEPCCTTLKERGDDHHTKLFGKFAIELGRGSWDGFCKVEVVHILHLTEIQGVVELL